MRSNFYYFHHKILLFLLVISVAGCDPDESLPTTIYVEPFDFNVLSGQGSGNNKITEVWVYANESFLAAVNPPVNVYYLGEGQTNFSFRPGIRNNGIASDAIRYPFFQKYDVVLDASPGASFNVEPITGYVPGTAFGIISDFELDNPFTDNRDTVSASNMIRSSTDVFEGQFAGEIVMSEEAYYIEVGHAVPISGIPTDGSPVYLEFRYKTEVPFSIGLLGSDLNGNSASNFFYIVNTSEEWNMLYIELTDKVEVSAFDSYKILFKCIYPADAPKDELHIFLDNIKVVYQP